MLPRSVAKTAITIYNFLPELGTFQRTVIRDCIWQQGGKADYRRQGTGSPDDITIQIPYNHKYFSVQNGEEFTGIGWTVKIGSELKGSYIVKGECPFLAPVEEIAPPPPSLPDEEVVKAKELIASGEPRSWFILTLDTSQVDPNDFFQNTVRPFEQNYNTKRPKKIGEIFEGSRSLWYLEVSC